MNRDTTEGNWKQFKGEVTSQRGAKSPTPPLDVVGVGRDQLTGKIREGHRVSKAEAGEQIRQFQPIGPSAARSD